MLLVAIKNLPNQAQSQKKKTTKNLTSVNSSGFSIKSNKFSRRIKHMID